MRSDRKTYVLFQECNLVFVILKHLKNENFVRQNSFLISIQERIIFVISKIFIDDLKESLVLKNFTMMYILDKKLG